MMHMTVSRQYMSKHTRNKKTVVFERPFCLRARKRYAEDGGMYA